MSQYVKAFNLLLVGCFTRIGEFTWKQSDCEEIVGQIQITDN
jgi:hypothetical protein